jgi:8-hydroxy-5-deazaflavin:NADPH oxidoreductase
MNIGILGSGVVAQTLGGALARNGHDVVLGTRTSDRLAEKRGLRNTSLQQWLEQAGGRGRVGTFAEAAGHGEVVMNATAGTASIQAIQASGNENLAGKVLIDVANPSISRRACHHRSPCATPTRSVNRSSARSPM